MFTIIIPTIWKSEFTLELLNRYNNCDLVTQIILINNNPENTPLDFIEYSKILHYKTQNIYVNPSWNLGVNLSTNENILISNDDVIFDVNSTLKYISQLKNYEVIGVHPESYNTPSDNYTLTQGHFIGQGWGCLLFVKKSKWIPIPEGFKIWFGDNWIVNKLNNIQSLIFKDTIQTKMSTSSSSRELDEILKFDTINWNQIQNIKK